MEHLQDNDVLIEKPTWFQGKPLMSDLLLKILSVLCTITIKTDIILLGYSKAFDKVPRRNLLAKLTNWPEMNSTNIQIFFGQANNYFKDQNILIEQSISIIERFNDV